MLRRPEADERAKPHIQVVDALQAVDQLFSVGLGPGASQAFQQGNGQNNAEHQFVRRRLRSSVKLPGIVEKKNIRIGDYAHCDEHPIVPLHAFRALFGRG